MNVKVWILSALFLMAPTLTVANKGGDCACSKGEHGKCAKKDGEKCGCKGCKSGAECTEDGKTSCDAHETDKKEEKKK